MNDASTTFDNTLNLSSPNIDPAPGQYLREKRIKRGFSVRELALQADCSASYITRVEHGQRRLDSMTNIIAFASILDFPVGELLQLTGLADDKILSPVRAAFPSIKNAHQEAVISQFAKLVSADTLSDEQLDQMIFNATAFSEYCQKCNQH